MNTNPNRVYIESGYQIVMAVSGGGQEVIGDLTKHGGMSHCVLEATVPYSHQSFYKYIGGKVDKIVSSQAARALAVRSYEKAMVYSGGDKLLGFGSTGSVVKDGERDGRKHEVFMAAHSSDRTITVAIEYCPGRTRLEEESLTSAIIKKVLKWGCHRHDDIQSILGREDFYRVSSAVAEEHETLLSHGYLQKYPEDAQPKALFCTSCNPLHEGHITVMEHASKLLNCKIDIELCLTNADKPPLDYLTLKERLKQTNEKAGKTPAFGKVILSNEHLFFRKGFLYPECTFIVGSDTFDRILDYKYYSDPSEFYGGFIRLQDLGCSILVYPRPGHTYKNLPNVQTKIYQRITTFIDESDFAGVNISSTEIRNNHA